MNRICKVCNIEKHIEEFRWHSATGYFSKTCKCCENKERRKKYISKEPKIPDVFKTCSVCKIKLRRTEENFSFITKHTGRRIYRKCCRECEKEIKTKIKGIRVKLEHKEEFEKQCTRCKEVKSSEDFYCLKSGYRNSYCKKCDSERKKERRSKLNGVELENIRRKERENAKSVARHTFLFRKSQLFDLERNLQSDLTIEFVKENLAKNCTYCGFPSTGLDRINNKLGHTIENCVPCCSECNTARMDNFSHEEMKIIGRIIGEVKRNRQI